MPLCSRPRAQRDNAPKRKRDRLPIQVLAPKLSEALLAVINIAAAEAVVRGHQYASLAPDTDRLAAFPCAPQTGVRICTTLFTAASRAPDGRGAWRRCPFTVPVPPVDRTQTNKHGQPVPTLGAGEIGRPIGTLSLSLLLIEPLGHELLSATEGSDSSRKHECVVEHQLQNGSPHSGHPILGIKSDEQTQQFAPWRKISIRYIVTWSPTVRSCRDLGSLLEMPFLVACVVNAHVSRRRGPCKCCTLQGPVPNEPDTSSNHPEETPGLATKHHRS